MMHISRNEMINAPFFMPHSSPTAIAQPRVADELTSNLFWGSAARRGTSPKKIGNGFLRRSQINSPRDQRQRDRHPIDDIGN